MIKKYLHNITNKLYFIPGYYAVMAVALSIIVILLDNQYAYWLQQFIPQYLFTSVDLAETILSTLAGSLFGMVTVSFSTIMVVLTMYSSQFSPRTLQDFLKSKTTLKVLGVFTGGFIYSILTLLFLRDNKSGKVVFSADMGVIIAIICLAYFIYFIHHVANSVQVNILIEKLRDEVIAIVDRIERRTNENEQIRNDAPVGIDKLASQDGKVVYANKNGYIEYIYDLQLTKLANDKDIIIRAEKMIGDYVTENSKVFTVYNHQNEIEDADKYMKNVIIDSERSKKHDIEFGMLKLTEVALRAISPGINDPNTAIFCINQLGWVLSRIAVSNIENTYYYNQEDEIRFILEDITFEQLLYKTFYQLTHYGNQDVSVAGAILDALYIIAEGSPQEIKDRVWEFSDYVLGGFNKDVLEKEDMRFLNRKILKLARMTNKSSDSYRYYQIT
ncbi:MAG: DUF2254 domain-containing protein [Halothermotrichaceae bacterium]